MTTKVLNVTFFLLVLFALSCRDKDSPVENSYKEGIIKSHNFKEVLINIDSLTFSFEYYLSFDLLESEGKNFFIGYNKKHILLT